MDEKYYNTVFELNQYAVRIELAKIDKPQAWLAEQCGETRQRFNYYYHTKSLKHLDKMAEVLGVNKRELMSARLELI
jgi:hypothetical protein